MLLQCVSTSGLSQTCSTWTPQNISPVLGKVQVWQTMSSVGFHNCREYRGVRRVLVVFLLWGIKRKGEPSLVHHPTCTSSLYPAWRVASWTKPSMGWSKGQIVHFLRHSGYWGTSRLVRGKNEKGRDNCAFLLSKKKKNKHPTCHMESESGLLQALTIKGIIGPHL